MVSVHVLPCSVVFSVERTAFRFSSLRLAHNYVARCI